MEEEEPGDEREEGSQGSFVSRWLLPFFEEPTLWPVTVAITGSLVAFLAGLLLMALRAGSVFAMAGVAILVVMSLDISVREIRRERRLGLASRCILGLWILVGLACWAAVALGLF